MINADKYWLEETLTYQLPTRSTIAHEKTYSEEKSLHGRISSRTQIVRAELGGSDIADYDFLTCLETLPLDTLIIKDGKKWTVVDVYRKGGKFSKVIFYHIKRL